jgi:hypothetical protein
LTGEVIATEVTPADVAAELALAPPAGKELATTQEPTVTSDNAPVTLWEIRVLDEYVTAVCVLVD